MNATLVKALIGFVPVCVLFLILLVLYTRQRTLARLLQLVGAACLMLVILTHVCEGLHFLSWFRWGHPDSVGHYIDLVSAVLAVTLLPAGYLFHVHEKRQAKRGDVT